MRLDASTLRALVLAGVVAGGILPAFSGDAPGVLQGRWVLVEETYAGGEHNLIADDNRVWLEFDGAAGRTWFRDSSGPGLSWPAFPDETGPLPVRPLAIHVDPVAGVAEAYYRVSQDPVGGLELEVREEYRLSADGAALSGTVEVTFVRDGREGGGFEMQRRFERAR